MSDILDIRGLCKKYPSFYLDNVSFKIPEGCIMGFIGRNGAGKTTTLKSMLGLVCPDSGTVEYFGMPFSENEYEIKQRIGFAIGAVNYYKKKKISLLVYVCKRFYRSWDNSEWQKYVKAFNIDESKTPEQLSEGMKVKLNLALALSHKAELLILDEPTSGLDPVSRDELLDVLLDLCRKGVSVLFSTHIISDLEKCADMITYIKNGRIIASDDMNDFIGSYMLVKGNDLSQDQKEHIHGVKHSKSGDTYLIKKNDLPLFGGFESSVPTAEEIMLHLEREEL